MDVTARLPGRVTAFDGLLAVAVAAVGLLGSSRAAFWQPDARPLDTIAYALVLAAAVALVVRRLWPVGVLTTVLASTSVYLAAGYPYGPVFLSVGIAAFTVAVLLPIRRTVAVCGPAVGALLAAHVVRDPLDQVLETAPNAVAAVVGWLLLPSALGTVVALRREAVARDREEAENRRAFEERLRVAREVHDVVGHGLAVINMQAGIALHVVNRRPDQAVAALEAIKRTSKDALDELRTTLAVFRRPDGESRTPEDAGGDGGADADDVETRAPRRPQPGLAQLDSLVAAMSAGGLPVTTVVDGERRHLPAAVDLAAYRIVQESLTNVMRHAGPTSARVRVAFEPAAVVVEVTDDGAARPGTGTVRSGHGLTGMRERAAAVGGTLEAGPRSSGGFRVRARLPYAGEDT